ncbi:MAG: uracil-DNA glycosylase [Arcobacteraceae bacterium]|nr:uracil-DNA glycosylase [Arcobacteraceae bacterium]
MNWETIIKQEKEKEYYKKLKDILDNRYEKVKVYPPKDKIFKAFSLCQYDNLKVVVLGQDPYHQPNQAQGLAFSTPKDIKNPPSMVNIFKEIKSDLGFESNCKDGDLTSWANQGILLINAVLTVEDSCPKSHEKIGWEEFTDNIIKYISLNNENIIFVLWGAGAIKKSKIIDSSKHHILTSPHPSPLSAYRGFFGCKHFSKINEILKSVDKEEIIW